MVELPHEYVYRLSWRATHKVVKQEGRSEADARRRVERMLMKEEGGIHCLEIQFVRQIR